MKQIKLRLLDFFCGICLSFLHLFMKSLLHAILVSEAVRLTTLGPPSDMPHIQLYEYLKSIVEETVKIVVA